MIQDTQSLRDQVKRILEAKDMSLRQAEEITGVSFSTISRFIRGGEITSKLFYRLVAFSEGKPVTKGRPKVSKRMVVGNKVFLVTIEELE